MFKYIFAGILFISPAVAAEKYTYQLSANEISGITNALFSLESYTKIIKDERGNDIAKTIPYSFKDNGIRLTIAQNIVSIRAAFAVFQAAAKGLSPAEIDELATHKQPVELLQIDINALAIDVNPYSPNMLSLLLPITELPK